MTKKRLTIKSSAFATVTVFLLCVLIFTAGAEDLPREIRIGVAGPHTGAYAAFGEQFWRGASQAVTAINAGGGVNGSTIKLVKADDACEPKQAVAVAQKLVDQDEVHAVIGHFCSSSSIPASDIYDEAGVLMISPASTNPTLTDRGLPAVFRVCGRDDQQGVVAANYMVDVLKAKRIAIVHDKDTYGKGLADATRNRLAALGVKDVLYEGLTRGEKDFNALVTKIRQVKADVVYFGGLHGEAGPLVRQLREQGSTAVFMSGDGIVSEDFVTAAGGGTFVNGVIMTFGADPRKMPAGRKAVESFRADGFEPEGYTLYAYAAVEVAARALGATTSTDGFTVARWLKANAVDTVMGMKAFDAKGDLSASDYVIYEWRADGSYGTR